jgi:tryptophanyl-tRNA synthetase
MGADILMFKAHKVPVGRDQVQHIEMARDMAQRFNHIYGDHLLLPEALIEESVATLPGLDGRKMSKSYDNTIPLFASREQLKKLIAAIVTDSRAPGIAKETQGSALFEIYQAFATLDETAAMRQAYADGISWGDAKAKLYERIDQDIAPMREQYKAFLAQPETIEAILQAGAEKARAVATPLMRELRHAVGLRRLVSSVTSVNKSKQVKVSLATFKQYREADGQFYFKLLGHDGKLLLQSLGFELPKDAALAIACLKQQGASAIKTMQTTLQTVDNGCYEQIAEALQQFTDVEV